MLPFANLSGDPAQDYLVDALTDEMTTSLARMRDTFVIAHSTAMTFKGKPVDAKAIGKDLGVRYVLEGSVQPSGDQMRVNAQLIDADSGALLWAEQFDTPRADLLQTQDAVVTPLPDDALRIVASGEKEDGVAAWSASPSPKPPSSPSPSVALKLINASQAEEFIVAQLEEAGASAAGDVRNRAAQAAIKEARGYDEYSPTACGRGRGSLGVGVGVRRAGSREPGRINHD
ncbi:MAG: hypothetical protein JO223_13995 [Hyphomicrobiales bacterium]|nr:hypothetical protein [Hyphomicrobiales bacterium]